MTALRFFYLKVLIGFAGIGVLILANFSPVVASSRTSSQYTSTTVGTEVIPYLDLSPNRSLLIIDMQRNNFSNVEYIHYNLNYNTTAQGTQRGVEGTIYPRFAKNQIMYWQGKQFFRQYIPLGTCSQGVCSFDPNPSAFKVVVHTKYLGKKATDETIVTVTH